MKPFLHYILAFGALAKSAHASRNHLRRRLAYHTLTTAELGAVDFDVTSGNPMKGLIPSPKWSSPPYETGIPVSVEFYYIGLDEVVKEDPDVVGEAAAYDWGPFEGYLNGSASRQMHAVPRFFCHWPGRDNYVPKFLLGSNGIGFNGEEPDYSDERLLKAMRQFIERFGSRYDGDTRLGFVQAGLIGKWGEWHGNLDDFVKDEVAGWYSNAFTKTKIQLRYPSAKGFASGFGIHDDSFAFSTLDGNANGGQSVGWYTWPRVLKYNGENFWKISPMGGETRPELQDICFEPSYPAGTFEKQDFMLCVDVTHATYMLHHDAFSGGYTGTELDNALHAHSHMGYNFHVPMVTVQEVSQGKVRVAVTVVQEGVAPFYYPLSLALSCPGSSKQMVSGVHDLVDKGALRAFEFEVPATSECLGSMAVSLESDYLYEGRPIKFAQGDGSVSFSLPLPDGTNPSPVSPPVAWPVQPPVSSPVSKPPVDSPVTPPAPLPPTESCGNANFQNECTSTGQCQDKYDGADDCWNGGGGVCYCGTEVCGCMSGVPPPQPAPVAALPTNPPVLAPVPDPVPPPSTSPPAPAPTNNECGKDQFLKECTTTGGCQEKYNGATDCWNGGGGVCYCGTEVCGCLLGRVSLPAEALLTKSSVSAPVSAPTASPIPAPISQAVFASIPEPVPAQAAGICEKDQFLDECTGTDQCKGIYDSATDCWNGGGGVCYCGEAVCGCIGGTPVTPPPVSIPPPVDSPVSQPTDGFPVAQPVLPPSYPESCGKDQFLKECTWTGECQAKYNGATDCSNSGGGVCYCGSEVCGCMSSNTPVPPPPPVSNPPPVEAPVVINPVPAPVAAPTIGECGKDQFLKECTSTGECQAKYSGADDCSNSGGGVCYCGSDVCGCKLGNTPVPPPVESPIAKSPIPAPVPTPTVVAPTNTPPPKMFGNFDLSKDLLIMQFDAAEDTDDIHSQASMANVLSDQKLAGIDYYGVMGAYGTQGSVFHVTTELFDMVFGPGRWSRWDADNKAVPADKWTVNPAPATENAVVSKVKTALDRGGDVWVMEAGQSRFTWHWTERIMTETSHDTNTRIHVIQHSTVNERMCGGSACELQAVKDNTDYKLIPDGNNSGNGSANLVSWGSGLWDTVLDGPASGPAWQWAKDRASQLNPSLGFQNPGIKSGGLDFSDTVELLYILGIPTTDISNAEDFFNYFPQ